MQKRSEPYQILCFGDSNTWGLDAQNDRRFPKDIRWTGVLADQLGRQAHIWENGVGGRTTVFDDPSCPERCSKNYLSDALRSTIPLDLVILNLGLNDTKTHLHTTPQAISDGMEQLIRYVMDPALYVHGASIPQILLCSPVILLEDVQERCPAGGFDSQSVQDVTALSNLYRLLSEKYHCAFLDSAEFASPSSYDGIHLDAAGHRALGHAIAKEVCNLLNL